MNDLGERLERLGLYQYFEVLIVEGFDTWDTLLDITESDLNSLNIKLGHRRRLQRAIAEPRQSADRLLLTNNFNRRSQTDDSAQEGKSRQGEPPAAEAAGTSTKRKYRRHPKPDEYAPERSSSAYVIFSNLVRETLKGQELSFTEIAKVVGERWQVLPANAREACERQANAAKEKFDTELVEYKKTPQYNTYQKYLVEFKAKHAAVPKGAEGKRSKLETDTSTSTSETQSRSDEQMDWVQNRVESSAQSDPCTASQHMTDASPPVGPIWLPSGSPYPFNATSPAAYSPPELNSSRMGDHYSPLSAASSRSAAIHKEVSFDMQSSTLAWDERGHSDPSMPYTPIAYGHAHQHTSTTPPAPYSSYYQAPVDLPSRRSFREPTRLSPLTHEDTKLSSNSGDRGYHTTAYTASFHPIVDTQKSNRMLPYPVPNPGATRSPLDRYPLPGSSPQAQQDYQATYSFKALVRAGETTKEAGDKEVGKNAFL